MSPIKIAILRRINFEEINFREFVNFEYFAGIYFPEFGKNSRKLIPWKLIPTKLITIIREGGVDYILGVIMEIILSYNNPLSEAASKANWPRACSNRPNEVRSIWTARGQFASEAAEEMGYYLIITHPMRITRLTKNKSRK